MAAPRSPNQPEKKLTFEEIYLQIVNDKKQNPTIKFYEYLTPYLDAVREKKPGSQENLQKFLESAIVHAPENERLEVYRVARDYNLLPTDRGDKAYLARKARIEIERKQAQPSASAPGSIVSTPSETKPDLQGALAFCNANPKLPFSPAFKAIIEGVNYARVSQIQFQNFLVNAIQNAPSDDFFQVQNVIQKYQLLPGDLIRNAIQKRGQLAVPVSETPHTPTPLEKKTIPRDIEGAIKTFTEYKNFEPYGTLVSLLENVRDQKPNSEQNLEDFLMKRMSSGLHHEKEAMANISRDFGLLSQAKRAEVRRKENAAFMQKVANLSSEVSHTPAVTPVTPAQTDLSKIYDFSIANSVPGKEHPVYSHIKDLIPLEHRFSTNPAVISSVKQSISDYFQNNVVNAEITDPKFPDPKAEKLRRLNSALTHDRNLNYLTDAARLAINEKIKSLSSTTAHIMSAGVVLPRSSAQSAPNEFINLYNYISSATPSAIRALSWFQQFEQMLQEAKPGDKAQIKAHLQEGILAKNAKNNLEVKVLPNELLKAEWLKEFFSTAEIEALKKEKAALASKAAPSTGPSTSSDIPAAPGAGAPTPGGRKST